MLPSTVAELTPAWFTEALGPSGVLGGGEVATVRADDIGTGVGVFGIIARLHLTYRGAPADVPATIVAKLPTDAEANRQVGLVLRLYEREGRFYNEVASSVPFRTPRCYLSAARRGRRAVRGADGGPRRPGGGGPAGRHQPGPRRRRAGRARRVPRQLVGLAPAGRARLGAGAERPGVRGRPAADHRRRCGRARAPTRTCCPRARWRWPSAPRRCSPT